MYKGSSRVVTFVTAAILGAASAVQGATYYKIGSDPVGSSSFFTNVSDTVGWAIAPDATETTPFSEEEMAESDFVIPAGLTLRTPEGEDAAWAFAGRSLRAESGAQILIKSENNAVITIDNLFAAGGGFGNGLANNSYTVAGNISIESGMSLKLAASENNATRTMILDSTICGDATTSIVISDVERAGTGIFHFKNLENFYGTIHDVATVSGGGANIYIDSVFCGSVDALSSKASLTVMYDGLPAGKGLVFSSTTIPESLKTKLTFYSSTSDFSEHLLPLVTFPAGTVVDPADFTIKFAASADGAARVSHAFTVVTNGDDTVTLAYDASIPERAKMVKGEGGVWGWRFYNAFWDDLTATCGLSVPDDFITVYVTGTDEIVPILANPGTPAGYRIETLTVNADANLADLSPLTIDLSNDFSIDLNGHSITVPGSFFDDKAPATLDPIVNGGFEYLVISANTYDTGSAITGWTKSSNSKIGLMKNYAASLYTQRSSNRTWCYITKGYNASQTIYVPRNATCTLTLDLCNRNLVKEGASLITYYASQGNAQIDGTTVFSWEGGTSKARTISSGTFSLSAGSHTLKISCTSNSGFAIDNLKLNCTFAEPLAGTITSSAFGGELHVVVPENSTAHNAAVNLTGNLRFVKEGAGKYVASKTGLSYNGGTEILEGTVVCGAIASSLPLGAAAGEVVVSTNGTNVGVLDLNGLSDQFAYPVVMNGGIVRNSWGDLRDGNAQLRNVRLAADSTFDPAYSWGVIGGSYAATAIDLAGHSLAVSIGTSGKVFYLCNTTIQNGSVDLLCGGWLQTGRNGHEKASGEIAAATVDFRVNCALRLYAPMSVRNYDAVYNYDYNAGTVALKVYGTFTPHTDYFYGCTMMDGSTIDLSGKTGAWSQTSSFTGGNKTVGFADNATVTVDLSGRDDLREISRSDSPYVILWEDGSAPVSSVTFVPDEQTASERYYFGVDATGLRLKYYAGSLLIFR
ncbi:MAG: hypothetical protein IJU44_00800 [Kiritimatiellae bacterium]|nr:hypothetical protein [Kiritimatiellia bacterium]